MRTVAPKGVHGGKVAQNRVHALSGDTLETLAGSVAAATAAAAAAAATCSGVGAVRCSFRVPFYSPAVRRL